MAVFMIPMVTAAICANGYVKLSGFGRVFLGTVLACAIGFFIARLLRTALALRVKRQGLKGEQVVGHQLVELCRQGFRIFHDYPLEFGNIDHVAVGPPGIFAIETKFRQKTKDDKEGYRMSFDGKVIRFPDSETTRPLEQAARQAEALKGHLERIFENLPVVPIVVYPGWYVDSTAPGAAVQVMNDTYLLKRLSNKKRVLDETTVQRVAAFLDEKCRDVTV